MRFERLVEMTMLGAGFGFDDDVDRGIGELLGERFTRCAQRVDLAVDEIGGRESANVAVGGERVRTSSTSRCPVVRARSSIFPTARTTSSNPVPTTTPGTRTPTGPAPLCSDGRLRSPVVRSEHRVPRAVTVEI